MAPTHDVIPPILTDSSSNLKRVDPYSPQYPPRGRKPPQQFGVSYSSYSTNFSNFFFFCL